MWYPCCLIFCGLAWGTVSLGLLDYVTPGASILASVATALIVGYVQRSKLRRTQGAAWYALPLLSILIAMAAYGVLEPVAEWLLDGRTWNSDRVEVSALWEYPLGFMFYGLTLFVWLTYPLALATHFLLRKLALPDAGNPA
jgi:hypothetical protein